MVLREPSLSFTIPSIHDDTTLDCRVYIPNAHNNNTTKRGTIIAHPYAPLGGCFNDPIVEGAAAEILRAGSIVGTFNFRGASGSKGRTSWTGKAEIGDYTSFAGFLIYYLHQLNTYIQPADDTADDEEKEDKTKQVEAEALQIVLGGYSYGSIIASKLPSIDYILYRFSTTADSTAFTEIILRARSLASQTREELQLAIKSKPLDAQESRESHYARNLQVGGEETPDRRPRSREGRLSMEIRKSTQLVRKFSFMKRKHTDIQAHQPPISPSRVEPKVKPAYLLISPLLPPISSLISISSSSSSEKEELQTRLSKHPSLAVFGSNDIFTSAKKLRAWAQHISTRPDSAFQFVEINGAGHFWHEEGVEKRLRVAVREWMKALETE